MRYKRRKKAARKKKDFLQNILIGAFLICIHKEEVKVVFIDIITKAFSLMMEFITSNNIKIDNLIDVLFFIGIILVCKSTFSFVFKT